MTNPDPFWLGPVGLDVAKHQSDVNWSAVRNAGYDFTYIKASEGRGYTDPKFKRNWLAAREVGLLVGAFHYARVSRSPTIEADAKIEAKWFSDLVAAQPGADSLMLPPMLDIEWDKDADKVIKGQEVIEWCVIFTKTVAELLGRTPGIYTGSNFWKWRLLRTTRLSALPLWQVHYTSEKSPRKIPGWPWTFWQWSHTMPLPGSGKTKVDADRYNGTLEQLRELATPRRTSEPIVTEPLVPEVVPPAPWWEVLLEITDSITRAISPSSQRGGDND